MFKEYKKINENNVKKVNNDSEKLFLKTIHNDFRFFKKDDLENIKLPNENQVFFNKTSKSRSLVNFLLNKNPIECYLFCSRLNKKSFDIIINKNLKGIGLSERVLENNPEFYNEVLKKTIVKLNNNHCKILIFKIEDNFYIITGSGNASINSRIENYIIENNEQKYNSIKYFFENA